MSTLKRTVIILLAALIVAAGLLALGQSAWANGVANAVITANQARMTAAYDANVAAGTMPDTGGTFFATAGNLARMLVVAAVVVAGSALLDNRRRARR